MKRFVAAAVLAFLPIVAIAAEEGRPEWAFPMAEPNLPPEDVTTVKHVPGSTKAYNQQQIDNLFDVPDWFPDEHSPAPAIVTKGRDMAVRGCGSCHLMNGMGHPESANVSALPVDYTLQILKDFGNGNITGVKSTSMIMIGKTISDADARDAAEWFAKLKPVTWIKVVESNTVPKSYVGKGNMRFRAPAGGEEAIGNRIIEIPQDEALVIARDPHVGFTAYVPVGSIKKGEALVKTGGGKTIQCDVCHGPELKGVGDVPQIAGRSPVYIVRQMWDIKTGARKGPAVALMQGVVANLTADDMIAAAAYVASRTP